MPLSDDLDEAQREAVFNGYRRETQERHLRSLATALRGAPLEKLGPELNFEQALAQLPGEQGRRPRGVPEEELKQVWAIWRREALEEAITAFDAFVRRSDLGADVLSCTEAHFGSGTAFESLCERLADDPRYRRLDPIPGERRAVLIRWIRADAATKRSRTDGEGPDQDYEADE